MLRAYAKDGNRLTPLLPGAPLTQAAWIDLYRPLPEQVAQTNALGVEIPTLEDMSEIEISSRLFLDGGNA